MGADREIRRLRPSGERLNRHVAICIAFATGLSLEVPAVPQAPIRDSPRPRYGAGPPPYAAIEVAFQNVADNVQLAGTLTVPRETPSAPAVLPRFNESPRSCPISMRLIDDSRSSPRSLKNSTKRFARVSLSRLSS